MSVTIFPTCLDALGEQQERQPCGFTGGTISFAASSLRWHFNTSITFLAKRDLGSIEISPIEEEEEEEEEEKMLVVRELEAFPKESGTMAMPALHCQHPPHPGRPCHLTHLRTTFPAAVTASVTSVHRDTAPTVLGGG